MRPSSGRTGPGRARGPRFAASRPRGRPGRGAAAGSSRRPTWCGPGRRWRPSPTAGPPRRGRRSGSDGSDGTRTGCGSTRSTRSSPTVPWEPCRSTPSGGWDRGSSRSSWSMPPTTRRPCRRLGRGGARAPRHSLGTGSTPQTTGAWTTQCGRAGSTTPWDRTSGPTARPRPLPGPSCWRAVSLWTGRPSGSEGSGGPTCSFSGIPAPRTVSSNSRRCGSGTSNGRRRHRSP